MAVSIREIRPDDLDAAVAAIQQAGGDVERSHVVTRLSVAACDDAVADEAAAPVGVALCVRRETGGLVLYIAFPAESPDPVLVRHLVGKAMTKVQSANIHACRVHMLGDLPSTSDPLSTGSNWYERFAREYAA
ncbi:MAG: hypothetical protein WD118_00435 [Phycisphaeraceae bacterium]